MLPPVTSAPTVIDVKVKRFFMSPALRRKHGAVNLSEYQAAGRVVLTLVSGGSTTTSGSVNIDVA